MNDLHPAVKAAMKALPKYPSSRRAVATAATVAVLRWAATDFGDMDAYYQFDLLTAVADKIEGKSQP